MATLIRQRILAHRLSALYEQRDIRGSFANIYLPFCRLVIFGTSAEREHGEAVSSLWLF